MRDAKEIAREALEDAIYRALEAGMSRDEIKGEIDYTLENAEDEVAT